MQVVGPKGSEILKVSNITTYKKTVEVPIPPSIDRDGGSFEIDLGELDTTSHSMCQILNVTDQ